MFSSLAEHWDFTADQKLLHQWVRGHLGGGQDQGKVLPLASWRNLLPSKGNISVALGIIEAIAIIPFMRKEDPDIMN